MSLDQQTFLLKVIAIIMLTVFNKTLRDNLSWKQLSNWRCRIVKNWISPKYDFSKALVLRLVQTCVKRSRVGQARKTRLVREFSIFVLRSPSELAFMSPSYLCGCHVQGRACSVSGKNWWCLTNRRFWRQRSWRGTFCCCNRRWTEKPFERKAFASIPY